MATSGGGGSLRQAMSGLHGAALDHLNERVHEAYTAGRASEALELAQQAVFMAQRLEPDDPAVAVALRNLAGLYKSVGRHADAEQVLQLLHDRG